MSLIDDVTLSLCGLDNTLCNNLLDEFGSAEAVFAASDDELIVRSEVKPKAISKLRDKEPRREAEVVIKQSLDKKIELISYSDYDLYPSQLRDCLDAPSLLYAYGDISKLTEINKYIAVVGTRNNSNYGEQATTRIVKEISEKYDNVAIVSGLAYGIDTIAHQSALNHNIPTIAVLAHGLDIIYPPRNRSLAIEIVRRNGVLLSEYPIGVQPYKQNFLKRNRIIAGLSHATIVSESPLRSGSLSTATTAFSYNREVFAIPGRIFEDSFSGNNHLISTQKATLLRSVDDINYVMGWKSRDEIKEGDNSDELLFDDLPANQLAILEILSDGDEHFDEELSEKLGISISEFTEIASLMELNDLIISLPGRLYTRRY